MLYRFCIGYCLSRHYYSRKDMKSHHYQYMFYKEHYMEHSYHFVRSIQSNKLNKFQGLLYCRTYIQDYKEQGQFFLGCWWMAVALLNFWMLNMLLSYMLSNCWDYRIDKFHHWDNILHHTCCKYQFMLKGTKDNWMLYRLYILLHWEYIHPYIWYSWLNFNILNNKFLHRFSGKFHSLSN